MKTDGYTIIKDSEDRFYFLPESEITYGAPLHNAMEASNNRDAAYQAGDYSLMNIDSDACEDMLEAGSKLFGEGFKELEYTFESYDSFELDNLDEIGMADKETEILQFINEWREKNESMAQCDYYSYWNGHEYKYIILSCDTPECSEPDYEVIDEDEARPILQAFAKVEEWEEAGFGLQAAYYGGYKFIDSYCEGHIGSYEAVVMDSEERLAMAEVEYGSELIETTSGQALLVEDMEEAKVLAEKYGLRICTYKKVAGAREWSCIDRNTTSLLEVSAADYGDDYELFGPDDTEDYFSYKVRPAAEGVQDIEELEKLAKDAREVVDAICTLGENEKVLVLGTSLVDTLEIAVIGKEVDKISYAIGVEPKE